MELEEGDLVLCIVDRIIGTVVFVKIEGNGEGSIVTSEIAPGRIRNIRDYVFPNKKIVCKILRINNEKNIELTLRRVTQKETKEVLESYSQEKKYISLFKSTLKEKAEEIISKIQKEGPIVDFIKQVKEDPKKLEKYLNKNDSEKIISIISLEKKKKSQVKKEISLKTTKPEGVILIKEMLESFKDITVTYIAAGKYSIKSESSDLKKADHRIQEIIQEIEQKSKKLGIEFNEVQRGK